MKKTLYIILILTLFSVPFGVFAQTTTSAVTGHVVDSKGESLPGATVQLLYKPTNSNFGVATNHEGRFTLANLPPGGPYDVTISFVGYIQENQKDLYLKLGETFVLNSVLKEESQQLNELVVVGVASEVTDKIGTGTSVGKNQIQVLPTLSRSFSDFTRLTPQSSNNSFAGTNFRYNNITLDGAVNNDAIGFSPSLGGISGTANQPGSSTRTNSFSLDAIQEVQVQIAPYDVSLGNFTGGSINAVSRSGTNDVTGSVYMFGRNNTITGNYKGADKVGDGSLNSSYYDYQTGFRLGMPIIKDKLFWFTNEEITHSQIPLLFPAGAPNYFMTTDVANQIINKLENMPASQYNPAGGYNPGATTDYSIYSKSQKFFNRIDWKINNNHSIALRNNTVVSEATNLERSTNEFQFGNYDFLQKNTNTSTVLEFKSRFGNAASNSLILGYTDIKDGRNPLGSMIFPQIQINGIGGGHALIGTNREAGIFNMRQKTFEFTDNFKFFAGNHNFTIGTHNEFYNIQYNFINSWNGRYDYSSLANFLADNPSRMRALYNPVDNTRETNLNSSPANFSIGMLSFYAQDELSVNNKLRITYGLRGDMTVLPTGPDVNGQANFPANPANYGTTYTYDTPIPQIGNKYFSQLYVSPRIGFNYDLKGDQSIVLRGGSGLFTGRIPFAWLGYGYVNNGVSFGAMDLNPPKAGTAIPTDPTQYQAFAAANGSKNRTELDVLDKNFQMPRMWRSNIAVDFKLPGGYNVTLEALYTQTIKDVMIKQVNLKDSVFYAPNDVNKQQPLYLASTTATGTGNRVSNSYSSVYLITNTNKGSRYQLTAKVTKEFPMGLSVMAAYTYGQSKDILNGIRNSPESGWQVNQSLNPNNPALTYSNFDIRHRIVASVQYKKQWSEKGTTYVSLIFTGQSGSPFTYAITSSNNLTRNGQQIDLPFIPASPDQINLVDLKNADGTTTTAAQQWTALDAFIKNDPYLSTHRGQYAERNGARTPWNNQADLRLMHDFHFRVGDKINTLQLSFDMINFTNLLNKNWGVYYFAPNTLNSSVDIGLRVNRGASSTAAPTYTFVQPASTYSIDQFSSRWQGQVGVRYIF
ncbi:MAG: TonB-dependent receptor [Bacteroidetes bacterium]|nr:TonB-dependent receptor [Bacteroidota bacterium]